MTSGIGANPKTENDSGVRPGLPGCSPGLRTVAGVPEKSEKKHVPAVKKIPVNLRRRRIRFSSERNPIRRFFWRLREDSQVLRQTIQLSFVALCVWIGVEFYFFVQWGMSGGRTTFFPRPPGVEGFLPISALVSFTYWVRTGVINGVHPAGLYIFLAIVAESIVLKKAFCSWLCPVGTLSESLWMLGKRVFGRTLNVPGWLDYPLRSLKYLLLLFFCWSISLMDVSALDGFISSSYNKVADVKMYLFFARISGAALGTILALMMLSVVIKNFWCRFLCPYGALLGMVGWVSPLKVTRNTKTCVDCELCTKACPADIIVHKAHRVRSDECTSCLACVEICPVKETLEVKTPRAARGFPVWVYGVLVSAVFIAATGFAILTGRWANQISREEYLQHFQHIESYDHWR